MKRLGVLLALGVLLGACSEAEPPPTLASGTTAAPTTVATTGLPEPTESTTSAAPPPANATTSTIAQSTTTAVNPAIPVPPGATEDDFEAIWRQLMEYHNWAFQNPELADAAQYLSPDCECFATAATLLDEYRQNGWRESSPGLIIHDVDVDIATSTFALMTIVDEHSPLVVVDSDGSIVRQEDRRPKSFYDVRVRLLDEGWRIVEWFLRGAVGDAE